MKKNIFRKWTCMLLAAVLLMLSGCGEDAGRKQENASGDERETESTVETDNTSEDAEGKNLTGNEEKEPDAVMAITDFGVRLLQQSESAIRIPDYRR